MSDDLRTNSLESYWMPFTPNREFKADPRMIVGAKGMHYIAADGHNQTEFAFAAIIAPAPRRANPAPIRSSAPPRATSNGKTGATTTAAATNAAIPRNL